MRKKNFRSTKRSYCAYCGRWIALPWVETTWQDPEGRLYKYHGFCSRVAAKLREKEALEMKNL